MAGRVGPGGAARPGGGKAARVGRRSTRRVGQYVHVAENVHTARKGVFNS